MLELKLNHVSKRGHRRQTSHYPNECWLIIVTRICVTWPHCVNTLRPRQNGRHFADDTFKRIFMNENARISINISLKFVPKGLINNIPTLVQIMAWRRPGDKPLSEPMMVNLLTHICVTRPHCVKSGEVNILILHQPTKTRWLRKDRQKSKSPYSCCQLWLTYMRAMALRVPKRCYLITSGGGGGGGGGGGLKCCGYQTRLVKKKHYRCGQLALIPFNHIRRCYFPGTG